MQDVPYEEQCARKFSAVEEALRPLLGSGRLEEVRRFDPWGYRNKMEYTFGVENDRLVCGLYSRLRKNTLVNVEECPIFSDDAAALLSGVREFALARGLIPYNKYRYTGFLRNLVFRYTKQTRELMVVLVTTSQQTLDTDGFVSLLRSLPLAGSLASVYWVVNDGKGDTVTYEDKRLLCGKEYVMEQVGDLRFYLYPEVFFQVNSYGLPAFHECIRDLFVLGGEERILDICCGIGAITLMLARHAGFAYGIEVNRISIDTALRNKELNAVGNVEFICGDARRELLFQQARFSGVDRIVINPPRSGLSPKVRARVKALRSPYILYSSCNPRTLAEDLTDLLDTYTVAFAQPFDFFPHTRHVETVTLLRRT